MLHTRQEAVVWLVVVRTRQMLRLILISSLTLVWVVASEVSVAAQSQQESIRVVVTLPVYADLVREIGGSAVEVSAIANPNEDAHFVRPKPSFALDLRRADVFVTTGLDLELWVPVLLDRASNSAVLEGGRGYIAAYPGIQLLDIPISLDRSGGDVHIYGNPHLTTDPLRALQVARNIATGLKRAAPGQADNFNHGLQNFTDQIYQRLFGDRLIELLGGETLEQLALSGNLFEFLEANKFEDVPLINVLGGWLAEAESFRGRQIICYHKNWTYFEDRFQVECADYVEAKPGMPPTPGHVSQLITRMHDEKIGVLLGATYFDRRKLKAVADRGNARLVQVPMSPGVIEGVDNYFSLVDTWVKSLAHAFAGP
jgi:zinc/manganese transport system substrate-binding protein